MANNVGFLLVFLQYMCHNDKILVNFAVLMESQAFVQRLAPVATCVNIKIFIDDMHSLLFGCPKTTQVLERSPAIFENNTLPSTGVGIEPEKLGDHSTLQLYKTLVILSLAAQIGWLRVRENRQRCDDIMGIKGTLQFDFAPPDLTGRLASYHLGGQVQLPASMFAYLIDKNETEIQGFQLMCS